MSRTVRLRNPRAHKKISKGSRTESEIDHGVELTDAGQRSVRRCTQQDCERNSPAEDCRNRSKVTPGCARVSEHIAEEGQGASCEHCGRQPGEVRLPVAAAHQGDPGNCHARSAQPANREPGHRAHVIDERCHERTGGDGDDGRLRYPESVDGDEEADLESHDRETAGQYAHRRGIDAPRRLP